MIEELNYEAKRLWFTYPMGALTVTVWLCSELRESDGSGLDGINDPDTMQVYVNESMSPDRRWSTALHEHIHLIESEFGFRLSESNVRVLESMLFQAIVHVGARFFQDRSTEGHEPGSSNIDDDGGRVVRRDKDRGRQRSSVRDAPGPTGRGH